MCVCVRARPRARARVRACVRAYLEEASARVEVAFETRRIDFIFNETSLCVRMCVRARKAVSVRVLYTTREGVERRRGGREEEGRRDRRRTDRETGRQRDRKSVKTHVSESAHQLRMDKATTHGLWVDPDFLRSLVLALLHILGLPFSLGDHFS